MAEIAPEALQCQLKVAALNPYRLAIKQGVSHFLPG
jgi:hypothetical protein